MKKKLLFLLSLLSAVTIGVASATACDNGSNNSSVSDTGTVSGTESDSESDSGVKATYTVTFVDEDGTELSSVTYEEGATVEEPEAPTKADADGYSYTFAGWDKEVTAVAEDVTYTATYTKTAIEYTITFMDGEDVVDTVTFTVETTEIEAPAVPVKPGYENGAWGAYDLTKLENQTVTASGYTAIEYAITFKNGEDETVVPFTVETTEIQEPELPTADHYETAWGAYDLTKAENQTVEVVYTAIEYKVNFVNEEDMVILPPVKFTIENFDAVEFPDVPEDFVKVGYTGAWDITPADLQLQDCTAKVTFLPNSYKITLDANGGSVEYTELSVTFDADYELPVASTTESGQYFNGWVDENGKTVLATGNWTIASDVTLKAVYSNVMSFDDGAVPAAFTKADTTESLNIVDLNGNKVLQLTNSGASPALNVTTAWLAEYFADENVDYIAFDARADMDMNNFRRVTLRSNGTFAADCYEHDMTYTHPVDGASYPTTGIRADSWKTFYFSRADYDAWVAQGVTSERFIVAGQFSAGKNVYIDNIRPVTAAERAAGIYSFESGGVRVNDPGAVTLLFYTLDQGTTWQFNMQTSGGFTNVGYTNEKVTDGIRALQFTKAKGDLNINFPSGRQAYNDIVTKTGYWAIDIYVPVGSEATISTESTGLNNGVIPCVVPTEGAWTTVYLSGSMNSLKITDTNGGTYFVDNIRSVTAEEYTVAQYGFEAGTVGLRTNLLNDANTHSGAAYLYNKGFDYSNVKASFLIAEGNAASDGNAVSNVRFDSQIVHSGSYSIAFDKGNGYVSFTRHAESEALTNFAGGFTFWLYSTVEIDGVNGNQIINGVNGKLNGGEGLYVQANTWTQITINADEIGNGRFLILQGSFAGTIYLDDFQPLPVADAE